MYGLTNAAIAQKLEAQEGAAACEGYVPVKERKKNCLVFFSLGDEMFDVVYLSMLSDVSCIADDVRKK